MYRKKPFFLIKTLKKHFSTQPDPPQSLYSFLSPSLFSQKNNNVSQINISNNNNEEKTLNIHSQTSLQTTLKTSLETNNYNLAWKTFKNLTKCSVFPAKDIVNLMITQLLLQLDSLNLKRAFACVVFLLEKKPDLLSFETIKTVFETMKDSNNVAPAFSLVKCMFKNRVFVPFEYWGDILVEISVKNGSFKAFLSVFNEVCRVLEDEKIEFLRPNLAACNAALMGCCYDLESVCDAESVIEKMAVLKIRPDESSFGFLAYLYALNGLKEKIVELEGLMSKFGFVDRGVLFRKLVSGYVKSGDLESVLSVILRDLGDNSNSSSFSEETFCEIVRGYVENGSYKDLANLINEAQKFENEMVVVEKSIGFGIVNACVSLGFLDKAHSVLDEMNTKGCSIGLGVYIPILKAYCKEQRTAEATQLVMEISNSGLELDVNTYDALIDAAMSSQDFQSAFSLFRDMREARVADLKGSYLTIMTGLTENHRPELMAAFLDEVVEDPRVEIGTHDWNSILHAFCKAGRLEDARRTFRRMIFLQFEPNEQTYLSLINGYANAEKYFSVLMLWNEVKKRALMDGEKRFKLDNNLIDAFLYALVKGGFFDAVMQVVEKSQEMKIFVDKWRYKQAFMEKHKKLKVPKLRKRNFKKMEALVAFKNWAGLST